MADDASDYPGSVDSFTALPGLKSATPTETDYHEKYQDAIVKIETELGANVGRKIGKTYADESARDAAITSPVLGDRVFLTNRKRGSFYGGTSWWPIPQIQAAITSVTFTSGSGSLTFPTAFTASTSPVVVANVHYSGFNEFDLHVRATTATTCDLYLYQDGVVFTGAVNIAWHAMAGAVAG